MTEQEHDKIKDKIKKLLALTESDNVNEAANAAARAQALIDQHNIDVAMLDEQPDDEEIIRGVKWVCFTVKKRMPSWRWGLLWGVAEVNDCQPWWDMNYTGGKYHKDAYVIGRPTDCQNVQAMYQFIEGQIDYLASQRKGNGRAWINSFRLGAVSEIKRRLRHERDQRRLKLREEAEAKQAAHPESRALVRVETALARLEERAQKTEAWMDYHDMSYGKTTTRSSGTGFGAGRAAGATVNIGGGGQGAIGDS
jgi:hypothetical protein